MERYIDTRFTHDTSLIRYYRSPLSNKSLNKSSQMSKMGTSWEKICRNFAKFLPIHFGGFWRESRLSFSLSLLLSSVFLSFCYPLKSKFGNVREKWRFHSISSPKKKKKNSTPNWSEEPPVKKGYPMALGHAVYSSSPFPSINANEQPAVWLLIGMFHWRGAPIKRHMAAAVFALLRYAAFSEGFTFVYTYVLRVHDYIMLK